MQIYLMRHGETAWNKEGRIQGSSDIELNDYGIELAMESRDGFWDDRILFDRIYCSPYIRARQTAQIINEKQHAPIVLDDRLKEMCFGQYEGKYLKEIRDTDPNAVNCFSLPSAYVADPSGETFGQVLERIQDFMQEILLPLESEEGIERVLVVCHGAVIRAFLLLALQLDLDQFWHIKQPNCSINLMELKKGTFEVIRQNILYYDIKEWKSIL